MTEARRKTMVLARLAAEYGGSGTALHYRNEFQLLIAVILSAQTTDARVNLVTPKLFHDFPSPQALAAATPRRIEAYIRSCGFFRTKARNIVNAARALVARHGGRVPETFDELTALPGVGRKTANVVLSVAFGQDAIAVDTHVFRVANRLALARGTTPERVERGLMRAVPRAQWSQAHHWLIHHGRQICHARNPECAACVVGAWCPSRRKFLENSNRRTG